MVDIRGKIARTAAAKTKARLEAMQWDTTYFDRIVPYPEWAHRVGTAIEPAFDEFAQLNVGSWWCRVVGTSEMRMTATIASSIGTYFPQGGAIRFSSIFGIVRIPAANDPFCALLYNPGTQRAFWVTQSWSGEPHVEPVALSELTTEEMLARAHGFAERLLVWENKHPAVAAPFEPYPRCDIAA